MNGTRDYSGTLDYALPVGLSRSLRFSLPGDDEARVGRYVIFDPTATRDAGLLQGAISETAFAFVGMSEVTAGLSCDFSGQVTSAGTVLTGRMTCSDETAGSLALGREGTPAPH